MVFNREEQMEKNKSQGQHSMSGNLFAAPPSVLWFFSLHLLKGVRRKYVYILFLEWYTV